MDLGVLLSKLGQTWPARLAKSVASAVTLPGDVASGKFNVAPSVPGMWSDEDEAKLQANDRAAFERAFDLSGLLMGGGMPMAQRGAAGIFGGRLERQQ